MIMRKLQQPLLFCLLLLFTIAACKPTAEELIIRGNDLGNAGKHAEAIKMYTRAIAENDQLQLAYYNRGLVYTILKKYKEALDDYTKVINLQLSGSFTMVLNKDMPTLEARTQVQYNDALYQQAQMFYHLDSMDKSFLAFQKLVDRNFKYKTNCILWMGEVRIAMGMQDDGCKYFQQANLIATDKIDKDAAADLLSEYCQVSH
jgi:tetratricopeptide (TPR) repeat protein